MTAVALVAALSAALAHSERAVERGPVAWALAVEGRITRNDGTWLDVGEVIEVGARLSLPPGATATVAHNGRIEKWVGPGTVRVGPVAARMTVGGTATRQPHVEELGNALTGEVRAPSGPGQVATALGIPLTDAAWARQDAIDGGQLRGLYRDVLNDRLAAAGVDRALVEKLGLLYALPGDGGEQAALVGRYFDLAGATPDAALLLEVPPTDLSREAVRRNAGGTLLDTIGGERPHTFRMSPKLDGIRMYGEDVADALRRRGHVVFGLLVPYANTAENIVLRSARPEDGVETLHQLLVRAGGRDGAVPTVALGYSQGAAVVRGYVDRYGDSDGLDYAVSLATMGGADGAGAEGVWSGKRGMVRGDGVTELAVVHPNDPARWVFGNGLFALLPSLVRFERGGRERGGDVLLHMGYHGGPDAPLPHGADAKAAMAVGTHGYPTAYLAPLYDDLLAGRHDGAWARRGDWAWDVRVELVDRERGDYHTWRTDPRVVADGYVAAAPAAPEAAAVPGTAAPAAAAPTGEAPRPTPAPSR